MTVSKSIPYVKGRQVNSLAKPVTSMSSEDVAALRAELTKIRATRAEKKKPLGPMHFPGNPSKRPQKSREVYRSEQSAKRKEAYEARLATPAEEIKEEPRLTRNRTISNKKMIRSGVAASASVGSGGVLYARKHNAVSKNNTDDFIGAAGGAAGAHAIYGMGGWAAKKKIEAHRKNAEAKASPAQRKEWKETWNAHKRKHGVEQTSSSMSHKAREKFYLDYPKSLPGGKAQRALAFKNKKSVYAGTMLAGASAGGAMAHKYSSVGKAIVENNIAKNNTNVREFSYLPENVRTWTDKGPFIRRNPISPTDMLSSGMMMAQAQAAGMGRSLSRKQRKAIGRSVRDYGEGRMFIYSPISRGSMMT